MPDATHFNWALVKSFVAVLDAGSLMGAARKLKAQQPTLSRHIAELEAQLGMPLFERTGRGVMPTVAALAIAGAARHMEAGAGIGFVAAYNLRHWRGVVPLLPMLKIAPLPCWLTVHREIRGSGVVRRVFEFLAEAIPAELARAQAVSP